MTQRLSGIQSQSLNEIQISGGNLAQSKKFYLNHTFAKARST